ncbi:ankyrin repeat domain-containing protein [Planctomicrobium piriforme]|uniref:Uncharacterized protein n=1 Tax=Planctomicrobium piriforme TaxID=1576369 RepID=A0A1I3BJH4_9PLAN|nr:ankyrin repeat domain-containing protein [Planctomicrobium piriforme]SFH62474.1 hypothetical protein SAMN05421753_101491 [Planctomicrobium piriforme]
MKASRLVITMALLFLAMSCSGRAGGVSIWNAVAENDPEKVTQYANAGGDVNIRGSSGTYPLLEALKHEKRKAYARLLELGADPNIVVENGKCVMHFAACTKDSFWLRLALDHGGNPNLINEGARPPFKGPPLAAALGVDDTAENVKLLVEHGADINLPDGLGRSPLDDAMLSNEFESILYLLDCGADFKREVPGDRSSSFLVIMKERRVDVYRLPEYQQKLLSVRKWLEDHDVHLDYDDGIKP